MNALQIFFVAFTFLRSISNGVDHMFGTSLSLVLSLTAIAAGVAAVWRMRFVAIHRRVFTLLACLTVFVAISGASFYLGNADGVTRDQYAGWYGMFKYVYLFMLIVFVSCVYKYPNFCLHAHLTYVLILFVIATVGLGQHLTGHAEYATVYDKYKRVAGLSSHPVPFSLEIVLTFCVCELSRWKIRLPFRPFHIVTYTLFVVALVFSASRTGVALLAIALGLFLVFRKPSLLPPAAATFALALWLTPFGELFSDLNTVPDYITSGNYMVWDWRTATTSVHWRIHHWYYLSTLGLERPWIGYGPGQEMFYSPFALEAHNQFVEIFFETGFIGLISFAVFWFSLLRLAVSDRARLLATCGKGSVDIAVLQFWIAMFTGITLVAAFDQSFNQETVSFSHLIISMFVVLSQPRPVTAQDLEWPWARVPGSGGLRATQAGRATICKPAVDGLKTGSF